MSQALKTSSINLRGSAQIVAEFFGYAINSILYQRGIYDPETFNTVKKYGMKQQVSSDPGLTTYLSHILKQLCDWLNTGNISKLVLVIAAVDTQEVLERWVFSVDTDQEVLANNSTSDKDPREIQKEIAAIIRQVTASVTFLPLLEVPCSFDLLMYTKLDTDMPTEWELSDPKYITQTQEVRLRSFTTKIHKVDTSVSYKVTEE